MLRAAIYSRYSSENQREASIEDQLEVCRRYIDRQGWRLVETYTDAAISGASKLRPSYTRLISDAEAGKFDVIVSEALDRLSRNLSDTASLYDRLKFSRVLLHTTSMGLISDVHIGIMGTMAQMTLTDLGNKVRRGQLGRARQGKIPGGLAFGYTVVPPAPGAKEAGDRTINEAEAEIIRRIFREYAAGWSPRRIAKQLNDEGVPGSGGRVWIDTTIRGQGDRGTGLLNNTLYIGQLSWNRTSYVKNPATGRRVARVNKNADREITQVPELRIVDQALWDAVKARQEASRSTISDAEKATTPAGGYRARFLLSGLLSCGCCGGGYTIIGKDRYGCATRRGKGTCDNGRSISRQHIEARVLSGLRERMLTPELVQAAVSGFEKELANHARLAGTERLQITRELEQIDRGLKRVMQAIEEGEWSETLKTRLKELEGKKASLTVRLKNLDAPAPARLHPNAAAIYRTKVADLQTALGGTDIHGIEAAAVLRQLIEKVVLTPDARAPDGLQVDLFGDLATIFAMASSVPALRRAANQGLGGDTRTSVLGSQLSVVAGTGFEPVTFRL